MGKAKLRLQENFIENQIYHFRWATSSLDPLTEKDILNTISKLKINHYYNGHHNMKSQILIIHLSLKMVK